MFKEVEFQMPDHDCDIILKFPHGDVVVQSRPSNADVNYNGSLDVILPRNMTVTNWIGDEMESAPPASADARAAHIRFAKQLVMEIP